MDATTTDRADLSYDGSHPVLVVASRNRALGRARRSIDASGVRKGALLTVDGATQRIEQQPAASAVWRLALFR